MYRIVCWRRSRLLKNITKYSNLNPSDIKSRVIKCLMAGKWMGRCCCNFETDKVDDSQHFQIELKCQIEDNLL